MHFIPRGESRYIKKAFNIMIA